MCQAGIAQCFMSAVSLIPHRHLVKLIIVLCCHFTDEKVKVKRDQLICYRN